MELRQLKRLKTAANPLSFNKSAGRLHHVQSGISVQPDNLEEDVQSFDRPGKRVRSTETGTRLLLHAGRIPDPGTSLRQNYLTMSMT